MQKIALIIPNYNNSETIQATLDSVQSQSYISKISAIYIADDGSTDNSITLAKEICKNYVPMNIHLGGKNVGQWNNLNRTISLMKETVDWFLILHSDDIAKPNWLEMMVSRVEACSEKVGSICSSWDDLISDGSVILGEDDLNRQIEVIEGHDDTVRGTLLKGCWWHISGCAIRLKAFEDCGYFNQEFPYQADWEWLLRCLKRGWAVEYIPRTLILYRQNVVSVSSKAFQTNQDVSEFIKILPQYIQFLKSSDIFRIHAQRIKFIIQRSIKSLIMLNSQRFMQSLHIFFMLLISLIKCQKQSKFNH